MEMRPPALWPDSASALLVETMTSCTASVLGGVEFFWPMPMGMPSTCKSFFRLVPPPTLIGATAAWGMWLALWSDPSDSALAHAHATLLATRPTAVNLRWALDRVRAQRSEEHTSELQSLRHLVCRLL